MRHRLLTLALISAIIFNGCTQKRHFINDDAYRKQVFEQFEYRKKLAHNREKQLFEVFQKNLSCEQTEALKFLYAYMPLSDLADYSGQYFLDQVNLSFQARDTFSWGKLIPEEIFRHFVLPVRVNNENLDTSRAVFFKELKSRVRGMNMEDAALEVNHWCHEKVNYRGSDSRTSSPLATMTTSFGRCGEESTFAVAALRSVGIPARQVYTPRWAHTDDNHAWVEVYVNNKWQYLGACEPEAVLNKGWFDGPVKRAMMVHTNVMGIYNSEILVDQSSISSKINSLPAYTVTKKLLVKVVNNENSIVEDAKVEFRLYNYAEFYPIVVTRSNKAGLSEIVTGLGDIQIWASKDSLYGYSHISTALVDTVTIKLTRKTGERYTEIYENIPPVEKALVPVPSEKEANNRQRLLKEDSVRNAYMATFMSRSQAIDLAGKYNLDTARVAHIVSLSYGNWRNISEFISKYANHKLMLDLLESMSEKDIRDIQLYILEDHLLNVININNKSLPHLAGDKPVQSDELFKNYILSPRISNEMVRDWRLFLKKNFNPVIHRISGFSSENIADSTPEYTTEREITEADLQIFKAIKSWVQDSITLNLTDNYINCPISPVGVYELRVADNRSRNIFFVAACRSMGIPARLDQATDVPQVYISSEWHDILFEEKRDVIRSARLLLTSSNNPIEPEYYIHYTLQKFHEGSFRTLDYEGADQVSSFPVNLSLEPGYYCLMTGHRKNDGSVMVKCDYFNLGEGDSISLPVVIMPFETIKKTEGVISMDIKPDTNNNMTLSELAAGKGVVLSFIDPGSEPSRHLLNDMAALKNDLENWGGSFIFITEGSTTSINLNQLPSPYYTLNENKTIKEEIYRAVNKSVNTPLPLVLFINSEGNITFVSSGYRIGTGENLLREMRNL